MKATLIGVTVVAGMSLFGLILTGKAGAGSGVLIALLLIVLSIAFYCLPALIAGRRNTEKKNYITLLNLLMGWTIIGWIAAFIWAVTDKQLPVPQVAPQIPPPPQPIHFGKLSMMPDGSPIVAPVRISHTRVGRH